MSAVVMREVGPPSVLQLEEDFPRPIRWRGRGVLRVLWCGCTLRARLHARRITLRTLPGVLLLPRHPPTPQHAGAPGRC
jgi:hypothetical protein